MSLWQEDKDVHTEHCCVKHGCKYGDKDCSVEKGWKLQSHPCESCEFDKEDRENFLKNSPDEVLISREEYDELIDKQRLLYSLYEFRVQTWENYEDAFIHYTLRKDKIESVNNEKLLKYAKENPIPQSWYDEEPQIPPE